MPSTVLGGLIPHRVLYLGRPLFSLPPRVFVWTRYVHARPGRHKLDPRAIKRAFLGYSHTQKGYKCYSPTLRHQFMCADVTFKPVSPIFYRTSTIPMIV